MGVPKCLQFFPQSLEAVESQGLTKDYALGNHELEECCPPKLSQNFWDQSDVRASREQQMQSARCQGWAASVHDDAFHLHGCPGSR